MAAAVVPAASNSLCEATSQPRVKEPPGGGRHFWATSTHSHCRLLHPPAANPRASPPPAPRTTGWGLHAVPAPPAPALRVWGHLRGGSTGGTATPQTNAAMDWTVSNLLRAAGAGVYGPLSSHPPVCMPGAGRGPGARGARIQPIGAHMAAGCNIFWHQCALAHLAFCSLRRCTMPCQPCGLRVSHSCATHPGGWDRPRGPPARAAAKVRCAAGVSAHRAAHQHGCEQRRKWGRHRRTLAGANPCLARASRNWYQEDSLSL